MPIDTPFPQVIKSHFEIGRARFPPCDITRVARLMAAPSPAHTWVMSWLGL